MILRVSLDIHRIIVINLCFGEIGNTVLPLFINSMTTGTINLVKYFPLFKPVNGILAGFFSIMRRYIVLYFFLGAALNKYKKTCKNIYDNQVLH